jgi:hypothetical protein
MALPQTDRERQFARALYTTEGRPFAVSFDPRPRPWGVRIHWVVWFVAFVALAEAFGVLMLVYLLAVATGLL